MGGKKFQTRYDEKEAIAGTLRTFGFTDYEVKEILTAKDPTGKPQPLPNLSDPAWKDAMVKRQVERQSIAKKLVSDSGGAKPRRTLIDRVLDQRYKANKKFTPWDYVQAESLKGARKLKADYTKIGKAIRQLRARRDINRMRKYDLRVTVPELARQRRLQGT